MSVRDKESFFFFSFLSLFFFFFPFVECTCLVLSWIALEYAQNKTMYSTGTPTQRGKKKKVKNNKIEYAGIEGELSIQDARLQATGCSSAGL